VRRNVCALAIVVSAVPTLSPPGVPVCSTMAGASSTYVVRAGDSLTRVSARFGVELGTLARLNALAPSATLRVGQTLAVDNRHLVCEAEVPLVINVGQRRLLSFDEARQLRASYPAGVGRADWKTPLGRFAVLVLEENPTWDVPASIQDEMRRKGEPVLTRVPPGPANPLGRFWIGLSANAVGIHGTIASASVHRCSTHGCIRLHPEDIADLYAHVAVGEEVEIVYEPVLLGLYGEVVYLEAHPDLYRQRPDALTGIRVAAAGAALEERIDWKAVAGVLRKRDGLVHAISHPDSAQGRRASPRWLRDLKRYKRRAGPMGFEALHARQRSISVR
jgi:L,D-transpeptidase ErfK/SrfK